MAFVIYAKGMSDPVFSLGEAAGDIFAGKAASRLPAGDDAVSIVNMRDVDTVLPPRSVLEIQEQVSAKSLARFAVEAGDIIMTARGAIRVGVADREHAGAIPGANTVVIRLKPGLPPRVVASYLRHPRTIATLLHEFVGSTTAGFSVAGLARLPIALPDDVILRQMDEMIDAAERYVLASNEAAKARQELTLELVAGNLQPQGDENA